VPNVRVAFREETLLEELRLLSDACNQGHSETDRINEEIAKFSEINDNVTDSSARK